MSKFVMKNRPKKPTEPWHVSFEIGNYVTLGRVLECIEKFKEENPNCIDREIMLEAEYTNYDGVVMLITAPPTSQCIYEANLQKYKVELNAYQIWQKKHKKEIEKHKAAEKKATAKRKLENTMVRLAKELEDTETKLRKA